MSTEKTTNNNEVIVDVFKGSENLPYDDRLAIVKSLSEKTGNSQRSCIAILSRAGLWKARVYASKTGEQPCKKEQLVDDIATVLGVPSEAVESLSKASKSALKLILTALSK